MRFYQKSKPKIIFNGEILETCPLKLEANWECFYEENCIHNKYVRLLITKDGKALCEKIISIIEGHKRRLVTNI